MKRLDATAATSCKIGLETETPATLDLPHEETGDLLPVEFECCENWRVQNFRINAPIILQQVRGGFQLPEDHFVAWKFCPWCGHSRHKP